MRLDCESKLCLFFSELLFYCIKFLVLKKKCFHIGGFSTFLNSVDLYINKLSFFGLWAVICGECSWILEIVKANTLLLFDISLLNQDLVIRTPGILSFPTDKSSSNN